MGLYAVRVLAAIACLAKVGHVMAAVPGEFVSSAMVHESLFEEAPAVEIIEDEVAIGGGIISFASVDASIDDEPAVDDEIAAAGDMDTGDGQDRASNPGCLATINKFRKSLGIPGMKYLQSKQQCVNKQVLSHAISKLGALNLFPFDSTVKDRNI